MTKLKALIIDDEPKLQRVLQLKLQKNCPDVAICGLAGNIQEAHRLIQQHQPQLLFLDIAMPGGSGFDLLDHFDSMPFEIIFVTGFNDFALDALRVSAVDYLLKPVNTQELIQATKKAKQRLEQRHKIAQYEVLKHNLNHLGEQASKIAIPGTQAHDFVAVADIIRCEGWQKYTRIYLQDGSRMVSSYNIGVFKELLVPYGF
ncbi:MAG: response regulator, partial [Bacteroidota bacterium]